MQGGQPHQVAPPSWPWPVRALTRLSGALAFAEGIGIALCLMVIVLLCCWQFVGRNLTTHHILSLPMPVWIDAAVRHAVFLIGFLGGAYATYSGRHIRIDAVTRALSPRRRLALRAFTTLAAIVIVLLFVYGTWGCYRGETESSELFSASRGALIELSGYAVVAFHFFVQLVLDLGWLLSGEEPPAEWIADAAHGEAG